MKVPSINGLVKTIRKSVAVAMITAPTAGAVQSCAPMNFVGREMPSVVHYVPPMNVPHTPPPKVYNFYRKPPVDRPGHRTPPPPPPRYNKHGDTFQRGGRR